MKIESVRIYPKRELSLAWSEMAENAKRPREANRLFCLRCGAPMRNTVAENARSRFVDVYICSQCGMDEAMRNATGYVLPLREWYAVKSNKVTADCKDGEAVLAPTCSFSHIFNGPKKTIPLYSIERPASEVVYARSDYNGSMWWTSWVSCQEEKVPSDLVEEVDSFHSALFDLPEFRTLSDMRAMCWPCAEIANKREAPEFNLYSETEHFLYLAPADRSCRGLQCVCPLLSERAIRGLSQVNTSKATRRRNRCRVAERGLNVWGTKE